MRLSRRKSAFLFLIASLCFVKSLGRFQAPIIIIKIRVTWSLPGSSLSELTPSGSLPHHSLFLQYHITPHPPAMPSNKRRQTASTSRQQPRGRHAPTEPHVISSTSAAVPVPAGEQYHARLIEQARRDGVEMMRDDQPKNTARAYAPKWREWRVHLPFPLHSLFF